MNRALDTRILAESAVMISLSAVLFMVKLYVYPQGGEVTLGSMVPILLLSLRRGARVGLVSGVLFSFIVLYLEPFVYYPAQGVLDYPLAFGSLGIAGLLRHQGLRGALAGTALGIGARFLCHFVSGIVFFVSYVPIGMDPYIYSAIYNASYLLPELAISATVITVLVKRGMLDTEARKI